MLKRNPRYPRGFLFGVIILLQPTVSQLIAVNVAVKRFADSFAELIGDGVVISHIPNPRSRLGEGFYYGFEGAVVGAYGVGTVFIGLEYHPFVLQSFSFHSQISLSVSCLSLTLI